MFIKLPILSILIIGISNFCLCQTSEPLNIRGTWTNTIDMGRFGKSGQTVVISKDTILIKGASGSGIFSVLQLLKYKIFQDTLVGTEIEFFHFNYNLGFIEEHYKHRQLIVKIPLCKFRNDCAKGLRMGYQPFRKESDEDKIHWDFSAWLASDAEKRPGKMRKDY